MSWFLHQLSVAVFECMSESIAGFKVDKRVYEAIYTGEDICYTCVDKFGEPFVIFCKRMECKRTPIVDQYQREMGHPTNNPA